MCVLLRSLEWFPAVIRAEHALSLAAREHLEENIFMVQYRFFIYSTVRTVRCGSSVLHSRVRRVFLGVCGAWVRGKQKA